jgi:hypothetical protein
VTEKEEFVNSSLVYLTEVLITSVTDACKRTRRKEITLDELTTVLELIMEGLRKNPIRLGQESAGGGA